MKYQLYKTISLLIFSLLVCGQTALAQQGELDTTFGTNNTGIYQDPLPALPLPNEPGDRARYYGVSEVLADGKIIVAGSALLSYINNNGNGGYASDFLVRRLNANGSLDTTFGTNGEARTTFYRWGAASYERSDNPTYVMKVQPADGKIIVASMCNVSGTIAGPDGTPLGNDLCLVRYNANGTLDTSFGGNTVFSYGGNPNYPGNNNTVDAGKVFTLTGTNTFSGRTVGFGGIPVRIRLATDGRIYVFGYNSYDVPAGGGGYGRNKSFVAVYSTSGALQNITSIYDTTGNPTDGYGNTNIYDGDILSNGDFIAVGDQRILLSSNPAVFSQVRWKVFTGSSGGGFLESDVNTGGSARAITMLRSNKILIGGQTRGYSQFGVPSLVRYNANLTVDTTFGTNGRVVFDGTGNNTGIDTFYIAALKTQPDGKIMGITNNGHYPRFNPDGSLDRSWAKIRLDVADTLLNHGELTNGRFITPFPTIGGGATGINMGNFAIRPNGRIVTAGSAGEGSISGPSGRAVVTQITSYLRNGGTFSDFNNDGKSEVAVFRGGTWYYLDSFSNAFSGITFGATTDKPVPADYDGDGKTDVAVYRPSTGAWYIYQSSNNQVRGVAFGAAEDLPRPGDFNGDGQADIAVFRPSNGTWYISYSNPVQPGNITFSAVAFGQSGDVPLLADFDGDGKSDIAVYRSGVWYYLRSSDGGFRSVGFGAAGDIPVVGDYDADARADVAVFRPSNGVWYRLNSLTGAFVFDQFGQNGDRPVPGDYDNDGKNDLAVFRNGTWYALRSADNSVLGTAFGAATDTPVPSAYLP